jgi:hypothetical protein
MVILDTNVVSELMKPVVSAAVETWCASQARDSLYITIITQAEILYGIAILPEGARQQRLQTLAQAMFQEDFVGKICPLTQKLPDTLPPLPHIAEDKVPPSPSLMSKLPPSAGLTKPRSPLVTLMTSLTAA